MYDRSGTAVRHFTYDDGCPGRMTAHRYAGHPQTTYRYDARGRVTAQHNPAGLSYTYGYEKNAVVITDSLHRREVLYTEGEGGLKRVIREERAGGGTVTREFDNAGRMVAFTDAAGRKTGQGRLCRESQTAEQPETGERLWTHTTGHAYAGGLATRTLPDTLPAVAWLTYGSGYITGLKLGDTPLMEFTRDRLHREIQRSAGRYVLDTAYNAAGQLQGHTASHPPQHREYGWNDSGQLVRVSGAQPDSEWQYDDAGRLIRARDRSRWQHYATDPAGNRLADRAQDPALPPVWQDNRIRADGRFFYHHDAHGRRVQKTSRDADGNVHHYGYDSQHRLAHYRCEQQGTVLRESRYFYDPLGRRTGKRVWQSHTARDLNGDRTPEVTWYGWDGDRLTTTQTATRRVQTVYLPGSFTPLVRIETPAAEVAKAVRRTLAEKFQQEANVIFPPELVARVDSLEAELTRGELSEASRAWLAQCGLTPAQIQGQMEPEYTPARKIHLYHCDHRGLPLALINPEGGTDWSAEYDAWGNMLRETDPHNLEQRIRLPGQQYDEETGLYYNRHRYYDPQQGRYITQDPIGLRGGWNLYEYARNPVM